ncbi:RIP metalloprotease RseP [Thiomicrorhabdus sp. 6S3-12]|uniref:RIP metalloprotease RseP n=1 Tax=Thiomicrorhabdus sp. 6S3-12 TaxID=2819681 RepID=UPI001AAC9337|nr:RIP metalloprotease RseP [Thiomicrorhabdus sp. 6S3-12]
MDFLWSLVGFLIVIGILVTLHEWGHFQVARWFNIKVVEFSIGFGKALYQKQKGETNYKIAMIPLGGFVRFTDEREGPVADEDLSRAFNRQSVYKRFAVVAAGPLINILFAWLIFIVIYLLGINTLKPTIEMIPEGTPLSQVLSMQQLQSHGQKDGLWEVVAVNGKTVNAWNEVNQQLMLAMIDKRSNVDLQLQEMYSGQTVQVPGLDIRSLDLNAADTDWLTVLGFVPAPPRIPAVIDRVLPEGPAANSGLQPGDRITAIDRSPVENWGEFVKIVQDKPDETVNVSYLRDRVEYQVAIHLGSVLKEERRVGQVGLGVRFDRHAMAPFSNQISYDLSGAIEKGWQRMQDLTYMSLQMLKKMLFGEVSLQHLSGPISIAQMSGQAVQSGLISFLGLLGLLSLSIGILNLLPIPVLDGGHLLYYLVEMIKGSPVSDRFMQYGQTVGLFLILSLTLLAIFNDILRISNG